jgi:hypothetical protein
MNQIAMLESLIEVLKNQMSIIEQQADDLGCCGNCKHYTPRGDCRSKHGYSPGHYCDKWYPDGLTRNDRK